LNDEIGACRWLVVAAPATPATHHLIAKATFDAMNAGTVLVNVARGSLVDEQELASALADGRLAAAGLDVFEHEPLPAGSPLWTMDNVLITAHAGGVMDGYDDAAVGYFVGNLARYRSGEPLHSVVDKAAGY
jgi:phosphoglycerate dehydrogenase-like enzyme